MRYSFPLTHNRKRRAGALALLLAVCLLTACVGGAGQNNGTVTGTNADASVADTAGMDFTFSDRDKTGDYDADDVRTVPSDYRITAAGTYILGGAITDTMVTVAANDSAKVQIILDNAAITNANGPAIYIQSADKVFVTCKAGTTNTISDGAAYTITDGTSTLDAAIFSRADLTINGTGTLKVTGNYKHAVVSKDDLVITSATLQVTAKNVGLNGKDCVKIQDAVIAITAGSDGIRSDNTEDTDRGYVYLEGGTLTITAGNDGIQAETALKAEGATVNIRAGSGSQSSLSSNSESYKGLKAGSDILITGGSYTIDSQDDCIHSNHTVSITDGTFTLASGDDGVHADTDLAISGGTIEITRSYEGLEGTRVLISGGRIRLVASDDGINAAGGNDSSGMGGRPGQGFFSGSTGEIVISGGYVLVDASGDGIDSNGTLSITGGVTLVTGPTNNGNGALDYDSSASISGGVLVALGSSGMAQSISSSTQGVVSTSLTKQNGGTSFAICDSAGKVIVSFTPAKAYEWVCVSAPGLVSGSSYTLVTGASVTDADENGYAENAAYTGGSTLREVEASTGSSGGGFGGMGGGFGGNHGGGSGRGGRK